MENKMKLYKGFIICPQPQKLAKTKEWTTRIFIEKYRNGKVTVRPFFAGNTFKSKEEAIQHCINFGMHIVDGTLDGCSVNDL